MYSNCDEANYVVSIQIQNQLLTLMSMNGAKKEQQNIYVGINSVYMPYNTYIRCVLACVHDLCVEWFYTAYVKTKQLIARHIYRHTL